MKLIRLSRGLLVVLTAVIASIVLPRMYWLAFDMNIRPPRVLFSPVTDKFLFTRAPEKEVRYVDGDGREYAREEFEKLAPLANYRQLAASGSMPDSLRGVRLDLKVVGLNNLSLRVPQELMDAPRYELLPMFESQSGRLRLEMPKEMFRITASAEFITAATNTIDSGLTRRFTDALLGAGFTFPASDMAGNPSTLKPFDEGYFVTDAAGKVFHLKKVKGEAFCRNIGLPDSIRVRKLVISETSLREFYGLLIAESNDVYLVSYDGYRLIRLPVTGYDPSTMNLVLNGDLFFRTITTVGQRGLRTVVTDRTYGVVARHEESWANRDERTPGIIAAALFPFTLSPSDPGSLYIRPFIKWSGAAGAVGVILSLAVMFLVCRLRKQAPGSRWFDFAVIACSGIFGLIAVHLIDRVSE